MLLAACGTSTDHTRWREYTVGREYTRARTLLRADKPDEARRIFANLRRLDPTNLGALYNEALLTTNPDDKLTLKEELLSLIDQAPNPELHSAYLALLSLIEIERDRRETMLTNALGIDPKNCLAHALFAMSLEERGELDAAYKHNRIAAQGVAPPPRVFRKLAAYEIANGKKKDAIAHLETYLEFEPDDVELHYNLGTLYLGEQAWSDAEVHLATAYDLDRQDLHIIMNYAQAAIENGRNQVATMLLDRALRLTPKEPLIYYNLGVFQAERLNDRAGAIKSFERYLELGGTEIRRVGGWIAELKKGLEE